MPNYPIDKLITDFDETVSEMDTIRQIVHAAAEVRSKTLPKGSGFKAIGMEAALSEREPFLAAWQEMAEWYSTRYARILDEWLAREDKETRRHGEHAQPTFHVSRFTHHTPLIDFLDSFQELEQTSIQRVMEKKFLAGLTQEHLRAVGKKIIKKSGVEQVLSAMRTSGIEIEILSANWSKTLIEGAMGGLVDQIITNDLAFDSAGHSTGQILMHVVSARDKLRHFRKRKSKTGRTLYIGDSISDFLALLEADLGVLIGENRVALQTIERFHIPTISIRNTDRFHPKSRSQGTILRVDSWEELDCFLKGSE